MLTGRCCSHHANDMQIPVDEEGLEWWEKLPTDKQGTLPVSKVTVDQIEDAHWQLVPHANWAAERERLQKAAEEAQERGVEAKGRLPGDGCNCKVCSLHQGKRWSHLGRHVACPGCTQGGL